MASAAPAAAEAFLRQPIACTLGKDCVIEDYVDVDPGPGSSDYACGLKSRQDHGGTDFALMSFEVMDKGVPVLSAADGIVQAVRDGIPDRPVTEANRDEINGTECGNAVRLLHSNGYSTLYCHMRNGTVTVLPGDEVRAGQRLGLVGLSGQTNYPHVHLTVMKDGASVDPFLPEPGAECGSGGPTLWVDPPAYERSGLFTAGFSSRVPDFASVRSGAARVTETTPDTPLVLYGYAFQAQPGDVLELSASGPDGEIFSTNALIEKNQSQLFRAYGTRAPATGWPEGAYRGYVRHRRDGRVLAVRHADIVVRK